MVAAALKAQLVTLPERLPHETRRLPTADGLFRLRGAAGRAQILVVLPMSLINLHDRFHDRVVIAPICAHVGRRSVRGTNAAESFQ
jgi:hypothetical protein